MRASCLVTEFPGGSPGTRPLRKAYGLTAGPARGPPVVAIAGRLLPPVPAAVRVPAAVAAVPDHGLEQGKRDDQQHAHGDSDGEKDADDDRYDLEPSSVQLLSLRFGAVVSARVAWCLVVAQVQALRIPAGVDPVDHPGASA